MRRLAVAVVASLIVPALAHAQGAPEPSWEDLLTESTWIARARVIEGGPWGATVQVERVFAGQPPEGPLTVVGYTDVIWPPPIIAREALRDGQTTWLFVQPYAGRRDPERHEAWELAGIPTPEGRTFQPPAPFAGDVPGEGDDVRVRLISPVAPHFGRTLPRGDWERLLERAVAVHRDGADPSAWLAEARPCLDTPVASAPPEPPDRETDAARCLGTLALLGETRWDPRLAAFADSPAVAEQVGAARVASRMLDEARARDLVVATLLAEDPGVAGMLVSALPDASQPALASALLPLLPQARQQPPPPDPVVPLERLRSEPVRGRILELVGALGTREHAQGLIDELPYLNPDGLFTAIAAIEALDPGAWVAPSLDLFEHPEESRFRAFVEAVIAHEARAAHPHLEAVAFDPDVSLGVQREALRGLSVVGDGDTAARVRGRLVRRLQDRTTFDADTLDMIASELETLDALQGGRAVDMAFEVARLVLGQPRATARPEVGRAWDAARDRLARQARSVLPPEATVEIRLLATDASEPTADDTVVLVDAWVPEGLVRAHRQAVAEAVGTPLERVRICGRGGRRGACYEDRDHVWRLQQFLALPTARIIQRASGEHLDADGVIDPLAAAWLDRFEALGLHEQTDTLAVYQDREAYRIWRDAPEPPPPPLPEIPDLDELGPSPF